MPLCWMPEIKVLTQSDSSADNSIQQQLASLALQPNALMPYTTHAPPF